MEKNVLETYQLTKRYGDFCALDQVSICLKEGHIYGFIGENGSGKTTLMCILTGLVFASAGDYAILGERENISKETRMAVGSTIEEPAVYPQYSAYQNMELQRILLGNPDKTISEELLKLVNLYDVKDKKIKKFSMGMKQRLSIALALIGKPKILILDEPVNGLDPKNMAELRAVLKRLNQEQKVTMLISSHILNELYQLATDYIIIHKGRIVETLSHEELEKQSQKYVRIRTDQIPACITVVENQLNIHGYKVIDDHTMYLFTMTDQLKTVSRALMEGGIVVSELTVSEQSIEEYFLNVTGGAQHV